MSGNTFVFPGGRVPSRDNSGDRPSTFRVNFEDDTRTFDADYFNTVNGRLTFFQDVPGKRDRVIASFPTEAVQEFWETDQ